MEPIFGQRSPHLLRQISRVPPRRFRSVSCGLPSQRAVDVDVCNPSSSGNRIPLRRVASSSAVLDPYGRQPRPGPRRVWGWVVQFQPPTRVALLEGFGESIGGARSAQPRGFRRRRVIERIQIDAVHARRAALPRRGRERRGGWSPWRRSGWARSAEPALPSGGWACAGGDGGSQRCRSSGRIGSSW